MRALCLSPVVANDEALLKKAQDTVRVKQEVSRQNLLHLQGLEIKHLENERKFIAPGEGEGRFGLQQQGNRRDQSALRPSRSPDGAPP